MNANERELILKEEVYSVVGYMDSTRRFMRTVCFSSLLASIRVHSRLSFWRELT